MSGQAISKERAEVPIRIEVWKSALAFWTSGYIKGMLFFCHRTLTLCRRNVLYLPTGSGAAAPSPRAEDIAWILNIISPAALNQVTYLEFDNIFSIAVTMSGNSGGRHGCSNSELGYLPIRIVSTVLIRGSGDC
jgi:hypothetical protein